MKVIIVFIVLIIVHFNTIAQEVKIDASYNYLFANQWDKAIQTYNFSRPFNYEKQPLLIHGFATSGTYISKSPKRLKQGINLSYSYFSSSSENENLDVKLHLNFLKLAYLIHYEYKEKLKNLYTDFIFSATTSALVRNVNGKPFTYDEEKSKAFGIGGDISVKMGYFMKFKNKVGISPFLLIACTPYFYSPNTEAVINQTKGLASKPSTAILSAQIGVAFHLKQP
jgi:hypothetical protein